MAQATRFSSSPYRSALAINNMAVNLIEKGYHEEALTFLTSSVLCIQSVIIDRQTRFNADEAFQQSSKRHADLILQKSRTTHMLVETDIQVLEDQDFAGLQAAAIYGPSASLVFPVRITESCCDGTDTGEMAWHFGIIHYNHGLASFLASLQRQETMTGKYLVKAHKSLKFSDTVFSALLSQQEDPGNALEYSTVILSAMVLNLLSVTYHAQNLSCEARVTERAINALRHVIDDDCMMHTLTERHTAAAA